MLNLQQACVQKSACVCTHWWQAVQSCNAASGHMRVAMQHGPTSFASHVLLKSGEESLRSGVQSLQGISDLAICVLWWQIMKHYLRHVMPHTHTLACVGSLLCA